MVFKLSDVLGGITLFSLTKMRKVTGIECVLIVGFSGRIVRRDGCGLQQARNPGLATFDAIDERYDVIQVPHCFPDTDQPAHYGVLTYGVWIYAMFKKYSIHILKSDVVAVFVVEPIHDRHGGKRLPDPRDEIVSIGLGETLDPRSNVVIILDLLAYEQWTVRLSPDNVDGYIRHFHHKIEFCCFIRHLFNVLYEIVIDPVLDLSGINRVWHGRSY